MKEVTKNYLDLIIFLAFLEEAVGFFYQIFPDHVIDIFEPTSREYFDMLDLETFKIIESLKCKKVLGYVTGGLVGWDEIFDYEFI